MRLYIAGLKGMVGSAIAAEAQSQDYEVLGKSSQELDLTNRKAVFAELENSRPDALVIAAAKVGGIGANSALPVDFLSMNLQIQTNLLDAAHAADIPRVLFLGSSCIYPKFAPQPISESALLTGKLEPTNESYAIAKIAGLKLVEGYRRQFGREWISAMPTSLYGPRDNFDLETAHVLPALIHRFHDAKVQGKQTVAIWGDGTPLREFLFVEDLAIACLLLIENYNETGIINVGSGQEISIMNLATLIAKVINFTGDISSDTNRPNGTPRKLIDSSRITRLGWKPRVSLEAGISATYDWFLAHHEKETLK
jgi:GDP-L-fucose synthase